jgi:alpha-ribazole phosphatase
MRLFVLVRHGQSLFNVDGVVNGDLRRDKGLSEQGVVEARRLGECIAAVEMDVAVASPFPRAVQTVEIALEGRDVPNVVDDDLGDVRIGDLEGRTLAEYRASKPHGERNLRFPGGESLNEAAQRYASAFARLLERTEQVTLVVTHEIPIRYALNGILGSNELDRPVHAIANAAPYLFDEVTLRRAVPRIRELSRGPTPREAAPR